MQPTSKPSLRKVKTNLGQVTTTESSDASVQVHIAGQARVETYRSGAQEVRVVVASQGERLLQLKVATVVRQLAQQLLLVLPHVVVVC